MLYALEPVNVKAKPGIPFSNATAAARQLSHTLGRCEVRLNFNGTIHIIKGDDMKTLSNFK